MKNNLRIAIDSRPLSMPHTGVALEIKQIILGLPKKWHIDLVSNSQINYQNPGIINIKEVVIKAKSRLIFEQIGLLRYLRKNKPDVYIATWNYGLPAFYRGDTKFILIINDIIPLIYPNIYLLKKSSKNEYLYSLRTSLKKANQIICISESTKKDLKKLFPEFNTKVIPITLPYLKTVVNFPSSQKKRYFIYLGGNEPRKRISNLIQAFARFSKTHSGFKLYIVGDGMNIFKVLVGKLAISDKVIFTGYVSEEVKIELISKSLALVFPSIKEGFGLPVAEGIICGTAVLSGDDAALREVAGDAALYVDSNSIDSISSALNKVISKGIQAKLKKARIGRKEYLTSSLMNDSYNSVIEFITKNRN